MNSKYYIKYEYGEPDDGSIVVYNAVSGSYFPTNNLKLNFLLPVTDLISVIGTETKRFKDIFGHKLVLYSSSSISPQISFIDTAEVAEWQIALSGSSLAFYYGSITSKIKRIVFHSNGDLEFFKD